MRGSTGILLVALGILLLYIILSDKYQCFTEFFDCLTGAELRTPEGFTRSQVPATTPPINGTTGGGFDPFKNNIFDLWDYVIHGKRTGF